MRRKKILEEKPLEPNTVEILPSGKIRFGIIGKGFKVKHHSGFLVNGTFDLGIDGMNQFMVVENGIISDIYIIEKYIDDSKQEYEIKQTNCGLNSGDKVINSSKLRIYYGKRINIYKKNAESISYVITIDNAGEVSVKGLNGIELLLVVSAFFLILVMLALFD